MTIPQDTEHRPIPAPGLQDADAAREAALEFARTGWLKGSDGLAILERIIAKALRPTEQQAVAIPAEPVAWRWEGRGRTGHWQRNITAYQPHQNGADDEYCRNVEPLYLATPKAPTAESAGPDREAVARLVADIRALRQHHEFTRDRIGQPGCRVRETAAWHVEILDTVLALLSPQEREAGK
jgi:hypothetical protein